jgi:hypothetical protein
MNGGFEDKGADLDAANWIRTGRRIFALAGVFHTI